MPKISIGSVILKNQKFAKKLLFFLRNVEKKSMILGDRQSRAGQDFNVASKQRPYSVLALGELDQKL